MDEVTAAARLALENERLQAEVRARLEELRASRARIVEAGDAERKRLERDLHDGAQQRLVGTLAVAPARALTAGDAADSEAAARLDEADAELREAIAELRELAHGIFPAVLADEGLAAAVEALAEDGRVPVRIRGLPEGRFAPACRDGGLHGRRRGGACDHEWCRRRGEALRRCAPRRRRGARRDGLDLVALEDRLGALDGRLAVERRMDGYVTIRAELPCGS